MRTFFTSQSPTPDGNITVHDARASSVCEGELIEVARGSSTELYKVTRVQERSFACSFVANTN
jgi:hypothetical protein